MDCAEKMQRCHKYVEALEEEKRKIQVFQRELPLCLELVTQAIEASKKELSGTTTDCIHGQSEECSEQSNSSEGTRPMVLEEFMPIKRTHSSSDNDNDDDDDEEHHSHKRISNKEKLIDHKKKSDWLKSVQLWNNQSPDPPAGEAVPRKAVVTEVKRNGGAFQPFHKEKTSPAKSNQIIARVPASSNSSTAETITALGTSGGGGGGSHKKSEETDSQKKQRRCWSPELHRRFLHALQQLGGSHTATPKQIRELMKVDGLTNDEVKSHLQKYRLHTRRPASGIHNNNNPQAPQFVVVGGIWVPPPEYAASSAGEKAANGIYAPVAAPAVTKQSHSEGHVRSNSPDTSSSTHTTTNSPL
ncbi:transcription factor HHO3-like [Euphorbia lathyris]|uniref:transcription factor HHO3-like n=1 Tax=Euphorbia lathyris TaxID=212925 RepID=UPI003313B908